MAWRVFLVFIAGGLGCVVRYLVAQAFGTRSFPYATLTVNLAGSFLIALIIEGMTSFPPNLRLALTTGFMGGLTTYSSFNFETTIIATGAHSDVGARPVTALLNVGITLIGCFLAGALGLLLGRRLA